MTSFLYSKGNRIFDDANFAEPLRERIRDYAQEVSKAAGHEIEHVNKSHIRKEDLVEQVLAKRGDSPGLMHVLLVLETCPSYKPWHNKTNDKTYFRCDTSKCLHYYFYFMDEDFGLCYMRVPTWAPFSLQFYCNGHSALAQSLKREGIDFVQVDNCFLRIDNMVRAQELADGLRPDIRHKHLDKYARQLCSVLNVFDQAYHWSIRQLEYSTDLLFKSAEILTSLYHTLSRESILGADAPRVASFLG
jgi:hypothetical protein